MKALLVIDMLNDFVEKGGVLDCGDRAREIVPFVHRKIEQFRREKQLVVFVCDSHRPDDPEFQLFPRHSIKGTEGARIIAALPIGQKDIIIEKTRYSAFYNTDLEKTLRKHRVDQAHIVGVCTSICVMDTVGDLRDRDYPVIVYQDGVADFDPEAHRFSLRRMEKIYGAEVV
jgi:nicotinamidase-related amidase